MKKPWRSAMSPSVLDRFVEEPTGKENLGPASTLRATVTTDGRRFSDVTNTFSFYSSRRKNPESFHPTHFYDKSNSEHQEIAYLKNLLAQKETVLESTRQELQKALYYSYKSSQQNKQLTQTNGQMFAELCMLREKFKLLEHDYKQMASTFRVKRAELEETVRELSQQLGNKDQILTKDPGQSENPCQSAPQQLSPIQNQNCFGGNPGEESNGGENNPGTLLPKEGKTDDKRTCLRRRLTSVSFYESPLHKKVRKEQGAVSTSTLDQFGQGGVSLSRVETLGEFHDDYVHKEGDCLPRASMSINEEASNEKRFSLRRRSAHVSYKEPSLTNKLRRSGPAVSTQKIFQSEKHNTSNVFENLEKARKGCVTDKIGGSSRINVSENEENKNGKRVCSKQCPTISTDRDLNLKVNSKQEEQTVQNLDKAGEDHALHFDVLQSSAVYLDLSKVPEGLKTEDIASKATRVLQQQLQETGLSHAQEAIKEIPLDKVGEIKELHCNFPRKSRYLSKISESIRNCDFPTIEATDVRRSSTGRPRRKAVETVVSYKEIPVNIKMRRSQ